MPKNGVAKEIRSYAGSLFIFLFVIGIIVTLLQFPVFDSNKEVVIGSISVMSKPSNPPQTGITNCLAPSEIRVEIDLGEGEES